MRGPRPLIATSVAPTVERLDLGGEDIGADIQHECVRSLHATFGNVAAFNFSEEVAWASAAFPDLSVVGVGPIASSLFDRPLVDFDRVWRHFEASDADVFGIANSDVYSGMDSAYAITAMEHARDGLVFFNRTETSNLSDSFGPVYTQGYDLFLFGRRTLEAVRLDGMAFGVPWWDYALPVLAIQAGIPVFRADARTIRHYSHDTTWSRELWRDGLMAYMNALSRQQAVAEAPNPFLVQLARITKQFGAGQTLPPLYGEGHIYHFGTMFAFWNTAVINDAAVTI